MDQTHPHPTIIVINAHVRETGPYAERVLKAAEEEGCGVAAWYKRAGREALARREADRDALSGRGRRQSAWAETRGAEKAAAVEARMAAKAAEIEARSRCALDAHGVQSTCPPGAKQVCTGRGGWEP